MHEGDDGRIFLDEDGEFDGVKTSTYKAHELAGDEFPDILSVWSRLVDQNNSGETPFLPADDVSEAMRANDYLIKHPGELLEHFRRHEVLKETPRSEEELLDAFAEVLTDIYMARIGFKGLSLALRYSPATQTNGSGIHHN
jgi:hypothetical protein